uniref:Putative secreted protein n=1 Tax=Amblyomma cajennense TaxID=34607 RepID=A0A023FCN1_AMBCJ
MRACSLFVLPRFVVRSHSLLFFPVPHRGIAMDWWCTKVRFQAALYKKNERGRWSDNDVTLALKERVSVSSGFSHFGKGFTGQRATGFWQSDLLHSSTSLVCVCVYVCLPRKLGFWKKKTAPLPSLFESTFCRACCIMCVKK